MLRAVTVFAKTNTFLGAGEVPSYTDRCQLLEHENGNMSDTSTYLNDLNVLALILGQLIDKTRHVETDLTIVTNLSQPGQPFTVQ